MFKERYDRERRVNVASHHFILLGFLLALGSVLGGCVSTTPNPAKVLKGSTQDRPSGAVHWPGLPPEALPYVKQRLDEIERSPRLEGGVVFIGDSITDAAPLYAMFPDLPVSNHGIAWDTSEGVLLRLGQISRHRPDRIFIMIGTNDTDYASDPAQIRDNIFSIAEALTKALPVAEVFVVSILPRGGPGNAVISAVNEELRKGADARSYRYLDLASSMRAPDGELDSALSYDNLHLNVHGYAVWERTLGDCVWNGCPDGQGKTISKLSE